MSKGLRTRREIVNTALTMALDVGLEGVTLGTLATELDLSKSGLFAHFRSKEALQLAVVAEAEAWFALTVVRPALALPRGEPRVQGLFEGFLRWVRGEIRAESADERPPALGGNRCIFMALAEEYDDRPGDVRDALVRAQRAWRATIERACRLAVDEGHFRRDVDPTQFAFEFMGVVMTFKHSLKLLEDDDAEPRARVAFGGLLARSRAVA
ncbi:TetR/AcrR family transcriptional regulator [Roseisolibacter sp. H3M3-2]|uniref:TetR/AcrR family transcriptional regulator n=1 Tax=Roseisolibacter sp. H3M3-2 TaxID=3031323 RepID=UPI0023DB14C8|nr:TetR/AcrR family transcriptional regulator [Roseisolibacter sp. H3M3-2]MDF1503967.1 TetR/AcrR family transcriptional regulator [Roseisolibacter sp. H3M3-2]